MSEHAKRFPANAEQAAYWNDTAGHRWVAHQASMDARLRPLTEALLMRAAPQPGENVLDIGCGSGATTLALAEAVGPRALVTGIDLSTPMLEAARDRCRGLAQVRFERADAQVHDIAADTYDLLVSRFGVMFFTDPYAAFKNLHRPLRAPGRLQFMCWAPLDQNQWFTVPLAVVASRLGPPDPITPRSPGPLAFSEPGYVEDILTSAGFRAIAIESVKTVISSPETPAQQAALYLKLGPAARFLGQCKPGPETLRELANELEEELLKYQSNGCIALGATVYYVSAQG